MEDPCRESLQEGWRTAARHDGRTLCSRPGMATIALVGVWTSLARRSLRRAALVAVLVPPHHAAAMRLEIAGPRLGSLHRNRQPFSGREVWKTPNASALESRCLGRR